MRAEAGGEGKEGWLGLGLGIGGGRVFGVVIDGYFEGELVVGEGGSRGGEAAAVPEDNVAEGLEREVDLIVPSPHFI